MSVARYFPPRRSNTGWAATRKTNRPVQPGPATMKADYEPIYEYEIWIDQELDPVLHGRIIDWKLKQRG